MDVLINKEQAIDKIKKRLYETALNNVGIKQDIDETLVDVAENRLESWFDEMPSVQPDTTTHDSIPAETGKNDGDGTSGDCISRQAAIEVLRNRWLKTRNYEGIGEDIAEECEIYLKTLPSVQPDIIRCKDCAYCDSDVIDVPYGMTKKVWWCDRLYAGANENLIVEPDDFCSWAERRE